MSSYLPLLLLLPFVFASGQTCAATKLPDIDLNGGDLPNNPVSKSLSTYEECLALCCSNPDCLAFSLNAGAPGTRWCYLKAQGSSSGPTPGVESGCLSNRTGGCPSPPPPPGTYFPWFNRSISKSDRVDLLLANFTLEEAAQWMNDAVPALWRMGLPGFSWEGEALHGVSWDGVATVFPQNIAWGATFDPDLAHAIGDVIATEARAKYVIQRDARGGSAEFSSLSFMTPNNNLFPDPLWGRGEECFGEEPVLTSAVTYAHIRGLQFGDDPNYTRIIATTKHFLGYHIESWAGDGQYRLSHSFNYSEADIQQYYFLPFKAAIRANVTAMMCEYSGSNTTNPSFPNPGGPEPWGTPLCASTEIARLMRDPALGWEGYVISDEGAISMIGPGYHRYSSSIVDSVALAINAGTDLALGGEYGGVGGNLLNAVKRGNVTEAKVYDSLKKLLTAQMNLGWFDSVGALQNGEEDPVSYNQVGDKDIGSPTSRLLAKQVALESLVLLKNKGGVLPLPSTLKHIALVGPAANWTSHNSIGSYIGNYAGCENGPGGQINADPRCHVVTLLESLTNAAGGFTLSYAPGCSINIASDTGGIGAAVASAAGADVIVAAVGLDTCQEDKCSEGEANDRGVAGGQYPAAGLDLPGAQLPLLQALREAYPTTPIIAVFFNGGPISSPWTMANVDAVLEAWYPGIVGGDAITEALLGGYIPAGRMPVTTVWNMSQLPPHTDVVLSTPPGRTHRYLTEAPLIPFGFGLSYASFAYSAVSVFPSILTPTTPSWNVSITLHRLPIPSPCEGVPADEVVTLYGASHAPTTGMAFPPRQQLLAFERVKELMLGETRLVTFTLGREDMELLSPEGVMTPQAGNWTLWVGGGPPNSADFGGGQVIQSWIVVQ